MIFILNFDLLSLIGKREPTEYMNTYSLLTLRSHPRHEMKSARWPPCNRYIDEARIETWLAVYVVFNIETLYY